MTAQQRIEAESRGGDVILTMDRATAQDLVDALAFSGPVAVRRALYSELAKPIPAPVAGPCTDAVPMPDDSLILRLWLDRSGGTDASAVELAAARLLAGAPHQLVEVRSFSHELGDAFVVDVAGRGAEELLAEVCERCPAAWGGTTASLVYDAARSGPSGPFDDVVVTDLEWDPWSAGPIPASMRFVVPEIMWDPAVVARFIASSEQEGATFPAVHCLEG